MPLASLPLALALLVMAGLAGVLLASRRARSTAPDEPAVTGPGTRAPVGADARPAPRTGRVLVVDDDERVRDVTCALLASRGWTVERASDAASASSAARRALPDVVLCDLTLPGPSGLDVLALLRAEFPEIKVVLMSGHADAGLTVAEGRAVGFVQKPFTGEALSSALGRALGSAPIVS